MAMDTLEEQEARDGDIAQIPKSHSHGFSPKPMRLVRMMTTIGL